MTAHILFVEDDENDRDLTMAALSEVRLQNQIVWARDGADALDYLRCRGQYRGRTTGNPVLVLLVLKLPKIDGIEVLRAIRTDPQLKLLPVVVQTSSNVEADLRACYELGVNAYVVKPVDFDQFFNAVKQLGLFWLVVNEPPPPIDSTGSFAKLE
jgi:CheY-like chemotaxis protein